MDPRGYVIILQKKIFGNVPKSVILRRFKTGQKFETSLSLFRSLALSLSRSLALSLSR